MLGHFHLTVKQWFSILKWFVYSALLLMTIVVQSVIFARTPIFGAKLQIVPVLLCCVCIREGPEQGGLFVLLGSLFYSLSGVDFGSIMILLLTFCCVFSAVLCSSLLVNRFYTAAICCFLTNLLNEGLIFPFKIFLSDIAPANFWRVLLPGAALSLLAFPVLYPLVKAISRIGGSHDL